MTTRATVQVTIEVELQERWGDECSIGQVRKQALDAAGHIIGKALAANKDIKIVAISGRRVMVFDEEAKP